MRKYIVALLMTLVVGSMFVGCTKSGSPVTTTNTATENATTENVSTEEPTTEEPTTEELTTENATAAATGAFHVTTSDGETYYYDTLEEYYSIPEIKEVTENGLADIVNSNAIIAGCTQTVKDNDMTYTYTLSPDADCDTVAFNIMDANSSGSMDSSMETSKQEMETETGIRPTSITYLYLDSEGNEVASITR